MRFVQEPPANLRAAHTRRLRDALTIENNQHGNGIPDTVRSTAHASRVRAGVIAQREQSAVGYKQQEYERGSTMDVAQIFAEFETLKTDRQRKYYLSQGAQEPVLGVPTGAMKPIAKQVKNNQEIAEALYATGNFDAMYLAGMIANTKIMTKDDFRRWLKSANFYMISDFIIAVSLSETPYAQELADEWIAGSTDYEMSAGWSCYEWLVGRLKDDAFDQTKLAGMLKRIEETYLTSPLRTQYSMRRFVIALAISYIPLHEAAKQTAHVIDTQVAGIAGTHEPGRELVHDLEHRMSYSRLGFKRKYVRC